MARFIVIHMTPEKVTQDEIVEGGRKVAASQVRGARWLNSWVAGEAEKLFCEWEAPDADAVRASLEPTAVGSGAAGDLIPIGARRLLEYLL